MAKRSLVSIPFVMLLLLLLGPMDTVLGDVSADLKQASDYEKSGNYEQAESIYKQIASAGLSSEFALEAQERLTCLYVRWDKEVQAQAGLSRLLSDFSQRDGAAGAVTHVADAYRNVEKHTRACEVYRDVIARWSQDEYGMWSQMGLVISHASLGQDEAADGAFEKLRTEYAQSNHALGAISLVADNYRRLERHDKARGVYEYALANWPGAEFALWSQMGLAISNIRLGDMDAADAAAEKLHASFSEDDRSSVAACMVADEYRKSNEHDKACQLYQYVVGTWPKAEHALWSRMGLAISRPASPPSRSCLRISSRTNVPR